MANLMPFTKSNHHSSSVRRLNILVQVRRKLLGTAVHTYIYRALILRMDSDVEGGIGGKVRLDTLTANVADLYACKRLGGFVSEDDGDAARQI